MCELPFILLGAFAIGCTRSANGKGSIALNLFNRAGTTVKRVFCCLEFVMGKMREEFEVWFSSEFNYNPMRYDDGTYITVSARTSWAGWQASRATLCIELPATHSGGNFGEIYFPDDITDSLDSAGVAYK